MAMRIEYIENLILDKIIGIITPQNDICLEQILKNEPHINTLLEELYMLLTTPQATAAREKTNKELTMENIWKIINERKAMPPMRN
jgi:hypothetical protein